MESYSSHARGVLTRYAQERPHKRPFLARASSERLFMSVARVLIVLTAVVLFVLIGTVCVDGISRLSWDFLTSFPSRKPERAGILSAWLGSVWLFVLTVVMGLPLGVGAAVYLEEYASHGRFKRLVEVSIANLAGVPSVIYGLLGLHVFVRSVGFGRSLLAGACTLVLLVLPVIIVASREALRAVPQGYRQGALALGATRWQTVWTQVLPVALPGIVTGCILALSRAVGETAPLITLGALTFVAQIPDSVFSPFTALPIQAFNWLSRPQAEFHTNAAAAIMVLLAGVILLDVVALIIRGRFQRRQQ